jgi:DNA-binding NarL/FixJ family response regulator
MVAAADGLALAGETDTVAGAEALIAAERPDIVVLDLGLADGSGVSVIRAVRQAGSVPKILVLSVFGDEASVLGALSAGADGYILKGDAESSLRQRVLETMDGGAPMSASIAAYVLRQMRQTVITGAAPSPLSRREVELLKLISRGLSNKEAAIQLGISPFTVGDYVKSIYKKLNVSSRGGAVLEAVNRKWLDP